jgi:2-methylcitrate dehydratase PrpD
VQQRYNTANGESHMTDVTRQLAEFASTIRFGDLPKPVSDKTCALLLDQFGIAMRARHEAAMTGPAIAALRALNAAGGGHATVVGDSKRYAPAEAAFLNGALGHALDFDDTHARGSIHSSAPIVWAAVAAAEQRGATGQDLIAAITAGYEIQIRLSLALVPKEHYEKGFHPTATCGVFGAAAAAGRILGLTAEQMQSAFGLCASQAAGSMQYIADGSWNKPYHVGLAAMNGLISATFAQNGFFGSPRGIEGDFGFLRAYAPNANAETAVAGLGDNWETLNIAVKPYPSCRYGHAAMDALIALRTEHAVAIDQVEAVEIGLPATGWKIIGDSDKHKQSPLNVVEGQFSMPFVGAVALRDGTMTWDSYEQHLRDEKTLALCKKFTTVIDPAAEEEYPAYMAGVARIQMQNGDRFERKVAIAKGEPENFPTAAELRSKFDGLMGDYLPPAVRNSLAQGLLGLENIADFRQIMALVQPDNFAPGTKADAAE